jgi:rhodanese-related sulfurtransferase
MTAKITRDELVELLASGTPVQFVETLRAEHFAQGHLPGAVHIHFEEVVERAPQVLADKDALIVTYCTNTACQNSRIAAAKLAKLGYPNVRRYEEGKQDWEEAGLELAL